MSATEYESESMHQFLYAIKSPQTRKKYEKRLENFFKFLEIPGKLDEQSRTFMDFIEKKGKSWLTANIIKYLTFQKDRAERGEISEATVPNYYKPIKLFLEMNEVELPWKKISRGIPRGRKYAIDRSPTIEEIQKLVEYPDRRIKAIVCTMCSSGIRLGAWDYLRWGDVIPIEKDSKIVGAKLIVYAGDKEQYYSFITPETYFELKKWIDYRAEHGEQISAESWLMRDLWNTQYSRGLASVPKKLQSSGIKRLVERALKSQGIRKQLSAGQRRYEFQADHGMRKFFKTQSEQKMKAINVEILMGHSTGISDSYYRPNETELLDDYLLAVSLLTISKEARLELENDQIKREKETEMNDRLANLEKQVQKMNQQNQLLHDFASVKYEKDPEKWAEKHLKFCEKYHLDPMKKYDLKLEMSEDKKQELDVFLKNVKKPVDL